MTAFPQRYASLLAATAFPHSVTTIEVLETHISWVILTGEFAYKIKRPVQSPFVDFRTLEAREYFCREELRLNRRFTRELYVDVCRVVWRDGAAFLFGDGEVLDYAVRMRQFDPRQELGQLVERSAVTAAELAAFGEALAAVHADLPVIQRAEEVAHVRTVLLDNARQCAAAAPPSLAATIDRCAIALAATIERLAESIASRAREGRVRECHGDLHMSDVARVDQRLVAFDCLEFEPAFSQIDVAQELAFLSMDLSVHGRRDLATTFLNAWLARSGDLGALELLDLFEAHRAMVRAKVCGLNVTRALPQEAVVLRWRQQRCIDHARECLEPREPTLVVMHGLSGSGKSWLAQRLAPELNAAIIRSDVERKRLAGIAVDARSDSAVAGGIYSEANSARVYGRLLTCARSVLRGRRNVIVDAAFLTRADRAAFAALAAEAPCRGFLIACEASAAEIERRVLQREQTGRDASEAGIEVLAWQRRSIDPVSEREGLRLLRVDTSRAEAVLQVLPRLRPPAAHVPTGS